MTAQQEAYRALVHRMAELTGTDPNDWFLVTKARQGMQTALLAMREATGRTEVISQLFTCVTAIDPILTAGLAPRYADISPDTLAADLNTVDVGDKTCAIVLQNTYGIIASDAAARMCDIAHQAGALVLEDSAHCVGRMARDALGNPLADVSVHSFGVEKMLFGTYFGGAVWVNPAMSNANVAVAVRGALEALPTADAALQKAARSYRNQVRMLTRLPHGVATRLRGSWERKGTHEPAVSEAERKGRTNHEPSKPSVWMCEQALAACEDLSANEARRRSCVRAYLDCFDGEALGELGVPKAVLAAADQPLLRFPVFAPNQAAAEAAAQAVADLGYYVPAWPRPLLVPGVLDPAPYGLNEGMDAWPVSERLSAGVVALPTDIDPTNVPSVAQAVLSALLGGRAAAIKS